MNSRALFAILLLAGVCSACGNDNPVAPGFAPAPDAPAISCPASISVTGVTGLSRVITYQPPSPAGGHPPVTSSCTPESGSTFPIGETLVTCNTRDSLNQQRTCSFTVSLSPLLLTATKFVAFGDSMTAGENGNPINGPCPARLRTACVDTPNSYPVVLRTLLSDEFATQTFTVVNAGESGRRAEGDTRLPGILAAERPDALLILHGFNDLLNGGDDKVSEVALAIRDQIRTARAAGVRAVFVSTLMPPAPGFRMIDPDAIRELNDELRRLVPAEGAVLVDAYPLFLGRESTLIAPDGLHLTPAGYRVLAEAFYAAIKNTLTAAPQSLRLR
jgi:lysophospholipase L1-like esterase